MKRYLILEDGTVFEGKAFGADVSAVGELVFTTGMCGYIETLTDESYFGQIVLQTFPLIGNYGIIEEDFEGECSVKAYAVREVCEKLSNFRCQKTLDTFLKEKGIPGICGIDTRAVTKRIREKGVMNAAVADEIPADLEFIKGYKIVNAVENVTCKQSAVYNESGKYSVALIDYGAKRNIIRELVKRGCKVTVMPAFTAAADILKLNPDGVMLSNGPGDPEDVIPVIDLVKKLRGKYPIFGICLGHQMICLACGAETYKLKFGHRGGNHPVKSLETGKIEITSQNHSYAVNEKSLENTGLKVTHINLLDNTVEGVSDEKSKLFSVQYHPESAPGPQDSAYLFDKFTSLMEENKNA